jgi:hypothetical protein
MTALWELDEARIRAAGAELDAWLDGQGGATIAQPPRSGKTAKKE